MSASERLEVVLAEERDFELWCALPALIDVVKAAEEGVNETLADEFLELWPILDALAALSRALEPGDVT